LLTDASGKIRPCSQVPRDWCVGLRPGRKCWKHLWMLRSGARCRICPRSFLAFDVLAKACGIGGARVWLAIWRAFLADLNESSSCSGASRFWTQFLRRKKGWESAKPSGQGTKWMCGRRRGRPRQKPARVIADKGYDSDALRERLRVAAWR